MGLESADCMFYCIVPVRMGGHQLELCIPVFLDGLVIVCTGFVVEDLEVYFMDALLYAPVGCICVWRRRV